MGCDARTAVCIRQFLCVVVGARTTSCVVGARTMSAVLEKVRAVCFRFGGRVPSAAGLNDLNTAMRARGVF